ncbi:NAD(P)-dependent oxidoreductase [Metabacillus herbersteinensis]|uniref:NAD(P)-dependent oxidoreductase n=1 Tax=Metabacillus herbersteinensis TaxID=283816 RepID=A0ABV6GF96_9BACI
MFKVKELRLVKDNTIIANVSRGGIVDEVALADDLNVSVLVTAVELGNRNP